MIVKQTTALVLSILIAGMLLSAKCNKDPIDLGPPNLCAAASPFQADFMMLEEVFDTAFRIQDTAILNRFVTFKAIGEYDSVKWEIGNSRNISTKLSFSLYFNALESEIPIKFTGYNAKNQQCFPTLPTVQTVTKNLTIVRQTSSAIFGRFLGYNTDNPADTFTVVVQHDQWNEGYLKNVPKDCEGQTSADYGYLRLKFGLHIAFGFNSLNQDKEFSPSCGQISSKGYLVGRDTLLIRYNYKKVIAPFKLDSIATTKTFRGVRQR